MKKIVCLLTALLLLAGMPAAGRAASEAASAPRQIILYTYYRQAGWGDLVQIGCVDADGTAWLLAGSDSDLKWPGSTEEQLKYLEASRALQAVGTFDAAALFDLKSLILSAEDQGSASHPVANDAGTEYSYAVQYDMEDQPRCVLLGMSGDDCFENLDPNAQALYLYLRRLFPQVASYGWPMGPAGFQPVSVRSFCGMDGLDLDRLTISASYIDCEAGPIPLTVSQTDRLDLLKLIRFGKVTGKANATLTTGGTVCYAFSDQEGRTLASVELYQGLLVRLDGMYTVAADLSALTEELLLTFTIGGVDYRLGVTTPDDLAQGGWAYETEADGVYSFSVPEYDSRFYAVTDGGKPADPIVSLNLMWADGLAASYCGFPADENGAEGAEAGLWAWLTDTLDARPNEEGALTARVPLQNGKTLTIQTKDTRVYLSLLPE